MKYTAHSILAASAFIALSVPVNAATIILNPGTPYDEVIHANSAGHGTSLNLLTMPSGIKVIASSSDTIDVGNGNGVSEITGFGGPTAGFDDLTIDPLVRFSVFQLKIEHFTGDNAGETFDLLANFVGGGSQLFTNVSLPTNGKIDILAGPGEAFDNLVLSNFLNASGSPVQFEGVKQMSFNVVPEPASWALMIAGFGLVGTAIRRSKSRIAFRMA